MPILSTNLALSRCPHCFVAKPVLYHVHNQKNNNFSNTNPKHWAVFTCSTCGGMVTAKASEMGQEVENYYPSTPEPAKEIPDRPRVFLAQAQESLHAPSGAVLLAGSAIDAMLKNIGYIEGSLYSRIEKAAKDNLITQGMAKWAHAVRIDANDQRHADKDMWMPAERDAQRCIDFALAFAEYLFVLPSKVQRGLDPPD